MHWSVTSSSLVLSLALVHIAAARSSSGARSVSLDDAPTGSAVYRVSCAPELEAAPHGASRSARLCLATSRDSYVGVGSSPYRAGVPRGEATPTRAPHTDAEIAASIRQRLRDSQFVDASSIFVRVKDGRAVLTGEVATDAERRLANDAAMRGGASEVDNRLHVVAKRPPS